MNTSSNGNRRESSEKSTTSAPDAPPVTDELRDLEERALKNAARQLRTGATKIRNQFKDGDAAAQASAEQIARSLEARAHALLNGPAQKVIAEKTQSAPEPTIVYAAQEETLWATAAAFIAGLAVGVFFRRR